MSFKLSVSQILIKNHILYTIISVYKQNDNYNIRSLIIKIILNITCIKEMRKNLLKQNQSPRVPEIQGLQVVKE